MEQSHYHRREESDGRVGRRGVQEIVSDLVVFSLFHDESHPARSHMSSRLKASSPLPTNRLSKNPPPSSLTSTPIADQFKALSLDAVPTSSSLYPSRAAPSLPVGRSTTPTGTGAQRQRNSYLKSPQRPSTANPSGNGMSNYGSTSGLPPPRPSRANTSNLNDIVGGEGHYNQSVLAGRRLSSPSMSPSLNGGGSLFTANSTAHLALDPGDSPPASVINGSSIGPGIGGRTRSGTVKNKKGMLSFMSGQSSAQS